MYNGYKYKELLISQISSEYEIEISESVEKNIPYIFLRECFVAFSKVLDEKITIQHQEQAIVTYTLKKNKKEIDVIFSYSSDENFIAVFLDSEMEPL